MKTTKNTSKQVTYVVSREDVYEMVTSSKEIDGIVERYKSLKRTNFPVPVPISFDPSNLNSIDKMTFMREITDMVYDAISYPVIKMTPELEQIYKEHKTLEKDVLKLAKKIHEKLDLFPWDLWIVSDTIFFACEQSGTKKTLKKVLR